MCKRKSFFGAVVVMVVVVVVGEYRAKKGRDDDGRSQKRFHGQSPPVSVALLVKDDAHVSLLPDAYVRK